VLAPGCQPQAGSARREVFLAGNAPREVCPWKGEPVYDVPSPEPLDEELMAELPPEAWPPVAASPEAMENLTETAPPVEATAPPAPPTPPAQPTPHPEVTPEPKPEPKPTPESQPTPEATPSPPATPTTTPPPS
jgi:hypothetical protein